MTVRTGASNLGFCRVSHPNAVCQSTYPKCNLFLQKVGDAQVVQQIWNPKIRNGKSQTSEIDIRNFGSEIKRVFRVPVALSKWPQNKPCPQQLGMFRLEKFGFRRHVRTSKSDVETSVQGATQTFTLEPLCM